MHQGHSHVFSNTTFRAQRFHRDPRSSREHQYSSSQIPQTNLAPLLSILPLLLFVVFSFMSPTYEPVFSLYKDYPYEHKFVTQRFEVPYYVKSRTRFEANFPEGSRLREGIEDEVRSENCFAKLKGMDV